MTMMVTNAILGGMADTVAQLLAAIQARCGLAGRSIARYDPLSIELHDLEEKDWPPRRDQGDDELRGAAAPFDFERLVRFMAYGMGMAPVQFRWYRFLEHAFPITKTSALVPALKRVLTDQLMWSPLSES
jgi:protein Mpv17